MWTDWLLYGSVALLAVGCLLHLMAAMSEDLDALERSPISTGRRLRQQPAPRSVNSVVRTGPPYCRPEGAEMKLRDYIECRRFETMRARGRKAQDPALELHKQHLSTCMLESNLNQMHRAFMERSIEKQNAILGDISAALRGTK
jgi:hypothetical protein